MLDYLNSLQARTKGTPLFITGHSLGAAQATIAAYELAVLGFNVAGVVTIASPRVGNKVFADAWNKRVGDGVGFPESTRSVPFIFRNLEGEDSRRLGHFDENNGIMRPSALLLAVAAEICGYCSGLHEPALNTSAVAALWNAHVAGHILPATHGRRMFGANLGTSGSFPLGAWRISNAPDIIPTSLHRGTL